MVTTRSADKRLDASRAEDLVLRSRIIGSPNSRASTPSQSQKRTANARESIDSVRSKRLRTELNGTAGAPIKSTHFVVNIPVKAINRQDESFPDGRVKELASGQNTESETTSDDNELANTDNKDQTTPNAKVTTVVETPDQGGETFKTPATSRHKRFDSEELDDDTIIVGTSLDSSAPQGYQTAEEEIADSNDDDEAPDVESTKVAPRLSRRKSARAQKVKKQSGTTLNTADVDDATIEVAPSQTETELLTIGKELPTSHDGLDRVTNVKRSEQEDPIKDTSLASSALETAYSQTAINSQPLTDTTPSTPSSGGPTSTRDVKSSEDMDAKSVTVSDSTLRDLSLAGMKAPNEFSGATNNKSFPRIFARSTQPQMRKFDLASRPNTARLPAKATSSLSDYRQRKFQQKVVGSAGGFKMQTDWSKRRSSFVVSS